MISFSDVSQINQASILKQVGRERPSRDSMDNDPPYQNGRPHPTAGAVPADRKPPIASSQGFQSKIGTKIAEALSSRQAAPPTPPKPSFPSTRGPVVEPRRVASEALPHIPGIDHQQGHERQESSSTLETPTVSVKVAPRLSAPPVVHRIHRRGPSLEHDPEYHYRMKVELQKSRERAAQEIEQAEAEANSIPRIVKKREQYDLIEEERKKEEVRDNVFETLIHSIDRNQEKERQRWMANRLMREEAKKRQEEEEERIREQKRIENVSLP
jgi:hypothetical protein